MGESRRNRAGLLTQLATLDPQLATLDPQLAALDPQLESVPVILLVGMPGAPLG